MDKILTIIVPSYNISRYIEDIVPHYIFEPLFDKLTVVFIDDGAKDNTVDLLSKYIEKYPSFFELIKKDNGGHGSVINFGVKIAKTKYIKIVDGDDWIDCYELNKLCDYLYNCDDDIVVSDFVYEFSDKSSLSLGFDKNKKFQYKIHLHNVTYKKSLWDDNNITVREKTFYEDSEYVLFPLEFAKSFSYFASIVYHYRCDNPNQSVNANQQLKHKEDYILVAKDLCEYYNRISLKDGIERNVKDYIFDNVLRIVFGAYEICTNKALEYGEAKRCCKELDNVFKKYKYIYKEMKKRYKKIRLLKRFNYFGLYIYLKRQN